MADLKHYGVLGMRWGVRRAGGTRSVSVGPGVRGKLREVGGLVKDAVGDDINKVKNLSARFKQAKIDRADRNWEKDAESTSTYVKIHNATADRANREVVNQINSKPQYKDVNFRDPKNADLYKTYLAEHEAAFQKIFNEEAVKIIGISPSGKKKAQIVETPNGFMLVMEEIKHSDDRAAFVIRMDDRGLIIRFETIRNEILQSEEFENYLMHYGVLGMRWGKRKSGQSVSVSPGVRGALKEVGGLVKDAVKDDVSKFKSLASRLKSKSEPSADYARSRQLKKKPVAKLSNEELKTVITRLQLEKQLKDLDRQQVGKGKRFISNFVANLAAKGVNAFVQQQAGPDYAGYQAFATAFKEKTKKQG